VQAAGKIGGSHQKHNTHNVAGILVAATGCVFENENSG